MVLAGMGLSIIPGSDSQEMEKNTIKVCFRREYAARAESLC